MLLSRLGLEMGRSRLWPPLGLEMRRSRLRPPLGLDVGSRDGDSGSSGDMGGISFIILILVYSHLDIVSILVGSILTFEGLQINSDIGWVLFGAGLELCCSQRCSKSASTTLHSTTSGSFTYICTTLAQNGPRATDRSPK